MLPAATVTSDALEETIEKISEKRDPIEVYYISQEQREIRKAELTEEKADIRRHMARLEHERSAREVERDAREVEIHNLRMKRETLELALVEKKIRRIWCIHSICR